MSESQYCNEFSPKHLPGCFASAKAGETSGEFDAPKWIRQMNDIRIHSIVELVQAAFNHGFAIAAGRAASVAQREPDPPGVHEHDDHTGLCPECVDAGRKLAAPAAPELSELETLVRLMESETSPKLWAYGTILSYCKERIALLRASQAGSSRELSR